MWLSSDLKNEWFLLPVGSTAGGGYSWIAPLLSMRNDGFITLPIISMEQAVLLKPQFKPLVFFHPQNPVFCTTNFHFSTPLYFSLSFRTATHGLKLNGCMVPCVGNVVKRPAYRFSQCYLPMLIPLWALYFSMFPNTDRSLCACWRHFLAVKSLFSSSTSW